MIIPPELKNLPLFLEVKDGDFYKQIGTAFILFELVGDQHFNYLITCRHVVQEYIDSGQEIFMRVNYLESRGVEHISLNGNWIFHPQEGDDLVDLAIMDIHAHDPPQKIVYGALPVRTTLGEIMVREELNQALIEGKEVIFIGLFENYPGHDRNYPLTRFGRIALLTNELLPGVKPWLGLSNYYLVECQAYPGMSGSPVFVPFEYEGEENLYLVGIMAGYYYEDEPLERKFTHYRISQVIPALRLAEILYGDEVMRRRKDEIRRRKMEKRPSPASTEGDDGITREEAAISQ
jgi:hypothetical protein